MRFCKKKSKTVSSRERLLELCENDKQFADFQMHLQVSEVNKLECLRAIQMYFSLSQQPGEEGLASAQLKLIMNTYLNHNSASSIRSYLETRQDIELELESLPQEGPTYDFLSRLQEVLIEQLLPSFEAYEEANVSQGAGWRNILAFFVCGLINNFAYVVMLSAAEDILKSGAPEQKLPTAAVLLADIIPALLAKMSAPIFIHLIPYWFRVCFVVACASAGFHLTGWGEQVWIKLAGVILASISSGYGEVTFLALTSFYHKNTVSAWSSGTGGAGILGSMFYLALKEWVHLTPFVISMICSAFPLLMGVSYFFVMTAHTAEPQDATNKTADDEEGAQSQSFPLLKQPQAINDSEIKFEQLSFWGRMKSIRMHLVKYMLPLTLVYFAEYYINQGVSPTLRFPNSNFSGSEYVYYQALYQIGVFISRSSVNIVQIRWLWIFPVLQFANLAVLFLQAIFHYIPTIWIIFAIILFEGLLGGGCYVNVYYLLSEQETGRKKEFALTVVSMSDALGISLAACAGYFTEPWLLTFQPVVPSPAAPEVPPEGR